MVWTWKCNCSWCWNWCDGGTAVIPIIGTVAGAAAMAGVGAVSGALVGAAGYFISIMFD